jgi:hypothetical protein
MNIIQVGYGPPVGNTAEGHPIYLYTDPHSKLTAYVVILPDGRAFYSDRYGRITAKPEEANKAVALALVGGALGLVFGPGGALIGAAIGAFLGNLPKAKIGQ